MALNPWRHLPIRSSPSFSILSSHMSINRRSALSPSPSPPLLSSPVSRPSATDNPASPRSSSAPPPPEEMPNPPADGESETTPPPTTNPSGESRPVAATAPASATRSERDRESSPSSSPPPSAAPSSSSARTALPKTTNETKDAARAAEVRGGKTAAAPARIRMYASGIDGAGDAVAGPGGRKGSGNGVDRNVDAASMASSG
mmetsp:Transcript_40477/g.121959  ORF Transcript_40477/g.121959 Transcript_40477/m.121959 type:complete len:202 (-) Transcript_40477:353-958(-)